MSKPDGGPAFPLHDGMACAHDAGNGMTLRDWFAGQALAGMCATGLLSSEGADGYAKTAYRFADAMLKERDR